MLLSLMVFVTSSGMAVNLHYCAGELQNVSLNSKSHDCGMGSPTDQICIEIADSVPSFKSVDTCCQDHQITAKVDVKVVSAKKEQQSFLDKTFVFINHYFISLFGQTTDDVKEKEEPQEISVFPLLKQGLYILLQQFRN